MFGRIIVTLIGSYGVNLIELAESRVPSLMKGWLRTQSIEIVFAI